MALCIFYSSETWLTFDLKSAESPYRATLKQLLSVRKSTPTDCLLIESDMPTAKGYIRSKQLLFHRKLLSRDGFWESYIGKALTLAQRHRTPMSRVIDSILSLPPSTDPSVESRVQCKTRVASSDSSRCKMYSLLNPTLSVSCIYTSHICIPEYLRVAYTRIKLSSHRLRIETGR